MRLSLITLATAAGSAMATQSDADASVWKNVPNVGYRSPLLHKSNRPMKRQNDSAAGWSPPSEIAAPLKEVWDHCLNTYSDGLFGFKNYGWDQLKATNGKINYCVRWESTQSITKEERDSVASYLSEQYQHWFEWLYGYDTFPFQKVEVNVVGWAVSDASLLQGSTDGIDVYTDKDAEGLPQCAPACGRFFHQDNDYSACEGGADRHYDQSLWLTEGFSGGAGGDWGQRLSPTDFLTNTPSNTILLHEMGHSFGLDDFYDWTPTGVSSFIMLAGAASDVTDFDGWMARNFWYELSRNRGW